jgi:hypothetical protein
MAPAMELFAAHVPYAAPATTPRGPKVWAWTPRAYLLLVTLYLLAFAAVAGAVVLFYVGVRTLLRVANG